ncbi:isoprenyl transferase [Bacteroidota bacterium]
MGTSLKEQVDRGKLPKHIAIIMDGNGRWAKRKGNERIFGHKNGVKAVRDTVEAAAELGISFLTLYAFSTENWNRPRTEIDALMTLLVSSLDKETKTLMDNNIRLLVIGDLLSLPTKVRNYLQRTIDKTSGNTGMNLVLALSYSSRWEILDAVKSIGKKIEAGELSAKELTCDNIKEFLQTKNIPDPELLIRTSGEFRVSNFLLWQIAYSELYFTDTLWPDFTKDDLYAAICDYQRRERRFGKISEQVVS